MFCFHRLWKGHLWIVRINMKIRAALFLFQDEHLSGCPSGFDPETKKGTSVIIKRLSAA